MKELKSLKVTENIKGNDFVVGDIHGCFSKLERQLKELNFDKEKDRLFSVGDLIDRGPESYLANEYLKESWFYAVAGNHETFLIDYVNTEEQLLLDCWTRNGGQWIFKNDWRSFYDNFSKLPLMMETEVNGKRIGIIHAELPKDSNWDNAIEILNDSSDSLDESLKPMLIESLQWGRNMATTWANHEHYSNLFNDEFPHEEWKIKGVDFIFVGHTPIREEHIPLTIGNTVLLDNGSCFMESRDLCVLNLNEWVK